MQSLVNCFVASGIGYSGFFSGEPSEVCCASDTGNFVKGVNYLMIYFIMLLCT